jgi:ubiquinone/menaquinone biosynthesis C-methylase UbiE
MGAASHLGIDLREYDTRIRTFIPGYEPMLDAAATALAVSVRGRRPVVVDLGIGTGALAASCLAVKPLARVIGIDEDEAMLAMAGRRLGQTFTALRGSFERVEIPASDAVTASLALHHIPSPARRLRLFRRLRRALRPGGVLIVADCYLASMTRIQAVDRAAWLAHLRQRYTARESAGYLRAWAREDHYARLTDESRMLERAGFAVDIVWRRGCFAVVVGVK